MRTYEEILNLILKNAEEDERIRAVTLEGSNSTMEAVGSSFIIRKEG